MRRIPPILLPLLALLLPAASPAEPLAVHDWHVRPADPRPYAGRIPHGSAARLVAYLPAAPASATFHWQTNGMGRLWWEAPAECRSNAVSVLWTPAMDTGAAVHRVFFRIEQPEGPDYSAFATLAMLDSPGFEPGALPMPVQTLDFAAVAWTNAPWALAEDIPDPPDLSAYATRQGLDRATNEIWCAISAAPAEWARPTWDSIRVSRLPDGASSVLAPRGDAMRRVTTSGGAALSAVRSVRPDDPADPVRDEPLDGAWALVGSPDCAVLSSNVLHATATPGAATVEFTPADGSDPLRTTVAMAGSATNYAVVAWPAGELTNGWRRAMGDALAGLVAARLQGAGASATVTTQTWNGATFVCTNYAGLALSEFLGAEGIRAYAAPGAGAAGGMLCVAPHYGLASLHCGPGAGPLRFLDEVRTELAGGRTRIGSRGDCAVYRLGSAVPTNLCARLLRESILARKSASRLFRFPAMHLNAHGYFVPVLVEPRTAPDLSGATWASARYAGNGTHWRSASWDGCDWADTLRPLSHDMHGGDSGRPVFLFLGDRAVPVYLGHHTEGANYTLLDDALLDWLDALVIDDSGGAERLFFLRESDL